jgi:hypothetical protein
MNPTTPTIDPFWVAIQQHHWPVTVGFVIVFLIYGANRLGLQNKVGAKWIPWISIALGVLSSIGAQLMLGISWATAISQGFLAGATATGLWEALMKHILPAVPKVSPVAAPVEAPKVTKTRRKPGPKPGAKKAKAAAEAAVGAPVEVAPVEAPKPPTEIPPSAA